MVHVFLESWCSSLLAVLSFLVIPMAKHLVPDSSWEQQDFSEFELPPDDIAPALPPAGVASSSASAEFELDELSASEEFANILRSLKLNGTLSAKNVCLLSYFAKMAGMKGEGTSFAQPPGLQTGKYSYHFDRITGLDLERDALNYVLHVPSTQRWTGTNAMVGFFW